MNDFSILDEIEKYLLEIFGHKTNALENKQRVYVIFKKIFNNKNRVWKYFWNWKNRKWKGVLWFTCYQKIIL